MLGAPATSSSDSSRGALVVAVAVLLPALAYRAALLLGGHSGHLLIADLRGLLADAGISLLVAGLLLGVGCASRLAAVLLGLLWTALQYANFEKVRVLGALASTRDIGFLGDATFVKGSALVLSHPALTGALLLATPLLLWLGLRGTTPRTAAVAFALGALSLAAHGVWPWADQAGVWRQTHFLVYNGERWLSEGAQDAETLAAFPDPPAAMLDLLPGLAADLDAPSILPPGGRARNVLLVILESVSGAHVPTLAADHGRFGAKLVMPHLDAIARSNLSYSTFISHQRQTNRGLYSLLCGEPDLGRGQAKMNRFIERGWRTCLPEILRDAGYHTVYLQAAPLAFMMKDQFMPRIGFDEVLGSTWFHRHYARSQWGIDDRAFFEQTIPMIDRLQRAGEPWFLTLLTVGTHHPYVVPADFRPDLRSDVVRTLAYLDLAIAEFDRALESLGVLEDTLVLITSDESLGLASPDNEVMRTLSQNWSFLIARLPHPMARLVDAPFAQVDIALSILDYLGLGERGRELFGRSVFRSYDRGRYLFFGNVNLLAAGALDPEGHLLLCLDDYRSCKRYAPAGGRVFGPGRVIEDWTPESDGIVARMERRSDTPSDGGAASREFALLVDPVFPVETGEYQMVHGGQYLSLRPGEWIDVDLEVQAEIPSGSVQLLQQLRNNATAFFRSEIRLRDGETLRLRYSFAPQLAVDGVRCQTHVRSEGGPGTLRFRQARMRLHTEGPPPAPGAHVQLHEIVPAAREGAPPASGDSA
jgi:hypothetical protein